MHGLVAIGTRRGSTLALGEKEARRQQQQPAAEDERVVAGSDRRASRGGRAIASYRGVEPSKIRYGFRAMMLETVVAVAGGSGTRHGQWTASALQIAEVVRAQSENERMHLMTFMEVSQPRWYERRALMFAVQGVFFNAYFPGYLISPKFAHRVVGYLEEEAIHSYTEFLKEYNLHLTCIIRDVS